ncbi:DUF6691 family protein [Pararhizobium antarcticum]|uniref:YeeE/YedE family protein n=1 Tax=Pararhizobium antarcticum TaxID=1798805 RepID=A0A657LNT7_9HYPH|nr:DUF6691 family protein [Pararhizobium antarcticum]OJF93472.1 hypothetical protein AX760_05620 [Pararhizobium antarcticum]OJG00424.1 hypothetical protein AX761_08350 [Rhizobium sp. 58]
MRNPVVLRIAAALVSGLVFGLGLSLSGMLDPSRVRGFLDVAGAWDPSLAFVLGGAVAVAALGNLVAQRMAKPVLDAQFHLPPRHPIDGRLLAGSAIFGIGWGIGGLCPGPALASLSLGLPATVWFVLAMAAGMIGHDRFAGPKT